MSITKEKKQELIEAFKIHEHDTGSPEVQIAILTERIRNLSEHFELDTAFIDIDFTHYTLGFYKLFQVFFAGDGQAKKPVEAGARPHKLSFLQRRNYLGVFSTEVGLLNIYQICY